MDRETRLKRLRFRAWHRGTREADYMIGGYFDFAGPEWDEPTLAWFETLIEEEDVDIMAWAIGTQAVPGRFAGPAMERMQLLDYIKVGE